MMMKRMSVMILLLGTIIVSGLVGPYAAGAGPYADSAHGDSSDGVKRNDSHLASLEYAIGNCAHCHEQHASMGGVEPDPNSGLPSVFSLFADNFDSGKLEKPYVQADNFCFFCHCSSASLQNGGGVVNYMYSDTFTGYTATRQYANSILSIFNMNGASYHNLHDVQQFAASKFSFFKTESNPCAACHNPHLVKRNNIYPDNPQYTAISRPPDHENLWGDDTNERMSNYSNYRAPYSYASTSTYEPNGTALDDGAKMPDYNTFCLDCHKYQVPSTHTVSKNPNTPPGYLSAIDWGPGGDMHGGKPRLYNVSGEDNVLTRPEISGDEVAGSVTAPYDVAPVFSNYVLSCVDCHEVHGSMFRDSYLLRREVNGHEVKGTGGGFPGNQVIYQRDFCVKCHTHKHCGGPLGCFQCHYHGIGETRCAGIPAHDCF